MLGEGADPNDDAAAIRRDLDDALADLGAEAAPDESETGGQPWLRLGLRLGLERPARARQLLRAIEAGETRRRAIELAARRAAFDPSEIPVCSMLLARSAAMPFAETLALGPEVKFGWAGRLSADEVLAMGRTVQDMLAEGLPRDVSRGFGAAWTGGVRVPREHLNMMLREFSELETTICGVLAGRDLRATVSTPQRSLLGGLLGSLALRGSGSSDADAVLERAGKAGQLGLVATWNAWTSMRYRDAIPPATFELLVRPWVTAVGPLPTP